VKEMTVSKAWDWNKETGLVWLNPSEESFYIAQRWKEKGYKTILDFGCGLGRHSVFFARSGFTVSAFDLSITGVNHLKQWVANDGLHIDTSVADMLELPYPNQSFDAIFAYHVISHTDSSGIKKIINEISRVLKSDGELYMTLCSKETWSYRDAGYPKLDDNTVTKTDEGPEKGIPHFYVNLDDILSLLSKFTIESIRHIDDCYFSGRKQNSKHYFITARK